MLNTQIVNTKVVNDLSTSGGGGGGFSGTVLRVSQTIETKYSGAIFGVTQSISFLATASQIIVCAFAQKINTKKSSGSVCGITQMVISP